MIAGGGSGGHIYPAIAIGRAIAKMSGQKIDVRYVGTAEGLEKKIVIVADFPADCIGRIAWRRLGGERIVVVEALAKSAI